MTKRSPEYMKKVNRLTLLGAICGGLTGLGGLATPVIAIGATELLIWSITGGILGGCLVALLIVLKMGADKPFVWGLVIPGSIIAGAIGATVFVKYSDWLEALLPYLS